MTTTTTIAENGTWQVINGKLYSPHPDVFSVGYWVGVSNHVARDADQMDRITIDLIDNGAEFVGIWTNEKTGEIYVDQATHVTDLIPAIYLARSYNQKAIWDIAHNTEIWV